MPAQRQNRSVLDGVVGKNRDIGSAAAKVNQGNANFAFFLGQHGLGRSQRLKGNIGHFKLAAMARAHNVLRRRNRAGNNVHLYFKAHASHAERVGNATLVINYLFLRLNMDDLAVGRNGNSPGSVEGALYIALCNLAALDGNDTVAVDAHNMAASNANIHRMYLAASHELRVFHSLADGLDSLLNIDHHPLAQTSGNTGSDAHHIYKTRLRQFTHHSADLCGADVEANDELGFIHAILLKTPVSGSRRHARGANATSFLRWLVK